MNRSALCLWSVLVFALSAACAAPPPQIVEVTRAVVVTATARPTRTPRPTPRPTTAARQIAPPRSQEPDQDRVRPSLRVSYVRAYSEQGASWGYYQIEVLVDNDTRTPLEYVEVIATCAWGVNETSSPPELLSVLSDDQYTISPGQQGWTVLFVGYETEGVPEGACDSITLVFPEYGWEWDFARSDR